MTRLRSRSNSSSVIRRGLGFRFLAFAMLASPYDIADPPVKSRNNDVASRGADPGWSCSISGESGHELLLDDSYWATAPTADGTQRERRKRSRFFASYRRSSGPGDIFSASFTLIVQVARSGMPSELHIVYFVDSDSITQRNGRIPPS